MTDKNAPSIACDEHLPLTLRPASTVMDPERLGSLHPFRLSFMRILIRRIMHERWQIDSETFELDQDGIGTAIYSIKAPHGQYSFVVFAHRLDPERRSDRVIANEWDMTVTLCEGRVDKSRLEVFRKNVPLQEAGRVDNRCIVLSRANKSSRNFDYVVDTLASGKQPSLEHVARVGYLYRTTAVYGSGKFGMADWEKVQLLHKDFARPFAAEMFSCYLIRQFSLDQAEHIAKLRSPGTAVTIRDDIKRYFGIGNATGLGMAPFLINHPQLISRWIEVRETALARVMTVEFKSGENDNRLLELIQRAVTHLNEIATGNDAQNAANLVVAKELEVAGQWLENNQFTDWRALCDMSKSRLSAETQELLHSLLMEMYPELVDDLEDTLSVDESMQLSPNQSLQDFKSLIEDNYDWALRIDFDAPDSRAVFWYRSLEKSEPRLGRLGVDEGADKTMNMSVALDIRRCYDRVIKCVSDNSCKNVAEFAIRYPEFRSIARRIQSLGSSRYGDIHTNLLDKDVLPIHLLRCKLSFFGVSKFDPKSRLWVRNTMFQGAPLVSDIGRNFSDDWYFPVKPGGTQSELN
ncbi:MAG: hypothetical protein HKN77_02750 [Woeseiaceae bacterium]|nr:hypothetical protein [Woeseiaceae bacterium]